MGKLPPLLLYGGAKTFGYAGHNDFKGILETGRPRWIYVSGPLFRMMQVEE